MSNVFSCVGTISKDAIVRYTASGTAVLSFSLANNVGYGDNQKTNWLTVSVWGKKAESNLKDYLRKGQQVFVSGELTTRDYQAKDGTTKTSLELNATVVDLVGKKADNTGYAPPVSPASTAPAKQPPVTDNFGQAYDDDIPF